MIEIEVVHEGRSEVEMIVRTEVVHEGMSEVQERVVRTEVFLA